MAEILGYNLVGTGPSRLIVLNDWISDTTSWDQCLPLIDRERSSWAFVDLRGYGRSMEIVGDHTLQEAVDDVLATADALGWKSFTVVGHSMSSLIALHLAQAHSAKVERVVVISPPPPSGLGADSATIEFLQGVALGDRDQRIAGLDLMWGDRLSIGWNAYKAARWAETATPQAAADYVDMFARIGMPDPAGKVGVPVLAITGEQDADIMRRESVRALLSPLCASLEIQSLADSGHYPMQEAGPLCYTYIERFLRSG